MEKAFLCLLLFLTFSTRVLATDHALAVLSSYGFADSELESITSKYPDLT